MSHHQMGYSLPRADRRGLRQWNAIRPDMLGHFLHDERIANNETNHLRSLAARLFAQNRAVIQLHTASVLLCSSLSQLRFSVRQKSARRELISQIQPYPDDRWRRSHQILLHQTAW